jgi:hypothetical protein
MQSVRNFFFYFSPIIGAVIGGRIGLRFHDLAWIIGAALGFGLGCGFSILMIVLSIRARFRADPGLTRSTLGKISGAKLEGGAK